MSTNALHSPVGLGRRSPLALRPRALLRAGLMLAAVLAGLLLYGYPAWGALGWAALLALVCALRLEVSPRAAQAISRVCFAAGPLVSYSLVEVLNYNNPWRSFSGLQVLLNLAWFYLGALALYLLTGRRALATKLGMALGWALGMANHYAIAFRGRTLFPGDLVSLRTALNVAGSYDFTPSRVQVTTGLALLLCLLLVSLLPRVKGRRMPSLKLALPAVLASGLFLTGFFATDWMERAGIEPSMWTTRGNGLCLNFSLCLRYSRVDQPEGYGPGSLERLGARYGSDAVLSGGGDGPVNVIAIMNESFSDLGVIPGVQANQDWMPFWRSLTENTVKGYAYASVFGGTTANSEYEFLTGNTTAFLPAGTVPYHMYVSDGDPSLAGQMGDLGYRTLAMHPYYASGWNRIPVYQGFGFDSYLFLEDFTRPEYMRGYLTDRCNYENLIAQYEQKDPGEKLFVFNVTMQNHSGYDLPWTNLARSTWLTGANAGRFPTVDQYLSVIYESDKAFQALIGYFQQVEEPTVILMFGDHQPQVSEAFYSEALGGETESLDVADAQRKQMVPFLIWANYDIPEADGLAISLNYLSTLLMKTAGLPMTGYQKFLDDLSRTLPVVNTVGLRTAAGWADSAQALPQAAREGLAEYQILLYNNIFDKSNRRTDLFTLAR